MRISETRFKLEEADYFFNEMRANQDRDNIFAFNLSGFVSAARSITWIMQKEFAHCEKFKDWYCKKQAEMKKDNDFEFFKELRNISIKRQSIPLNRLVQFGTLKLGLSLEPVDVIITGINGKPISKTKSKHQNVSSEKREESKVSSHWFFTGKQKNVVGFCYEYLNKLDKLVQECESIFLKKL